MHRKSMVRTLPRDWVFQHPGYGSELVQCLGEHRLIPYGTISFNGNRLAICLLVRKNELDLPKSGYHGEPVICFINQTAKQIVYSECQLDDAFTNWDQVKVLVDLMHNLPPYTM